MVRFHDAALLPHCFLVATRPMLARTSATKQMTAVWACICVGCALLLPGCAQCCWPRIDPTGERLFLPCDAPWPIPAPPLVAGGPLAPIAPAQWGISVSPSQVIAPVGSEVVMIASVCGSEGFMLTRQRVEWMLGGDGPGQFMSPGQRHPFEVLNWMHGLPKKIDNRLVINTTLASPMTLDRGTPTPTDDVLVQDGQAWVSVTSPTEGTSHVTVFAPEIPGWDRRQQTATIYWVDAQWRFPSPAITPVGSRHGLSTVVTRQSDNTPLPGWMVRYEIVGGPEAGFAPDGARSVEVATGPSGEAVAELLQAQPSPGTNQVSIQVIRPPGVGGQSRALPIGAGSVLHTWAASGSGVPTGPPLSSGAPVVAPPPTTSPGQAIPAAGRLEVSLNGPDTAEVGTDVQFEIAVVNRGAATATRLLVSDRFDLGLEHAVATSPIERDLADLPPGGTARFDVNFRVTRPGQLCQDITVTAEGGLRGVARRCIVASQRVAEQSQPTPAEDTSSQPAEAPPAQIPAAEPATAAPTGSSPVVIKQTGPTRQRVGETALFTIEVTNQGRQTIENVEIANNFETTLRPLRATEDSSWLAGGALGWRIPRLEPGKTIRRSIEFTCLRETPRSCNRVAVSGTGLTPVAEEACLEISGPESEAAAAVDGQPPLEVTVAETADPVKVGGETTYQILVSNKSSQSVFDVTLTVTYGNELRFEGAASPLPERPKILPGEIRFPAAREIRSGENPLNFELRFKGAAPGTATVRIEVGSRGQTRPVTSEQTTEVLQ
jgi:uncharacterized repeat protein (TIGR01451 family)